VLDTPPSRHALDFLEAPGRLARFIEGRAFQAFLPKGDGLIARAASALLHKILSAVFGHDTATEFVSFLSLFSGIFAALNADVGQMRATLGGPDVAFLLVASPAPATLIEAQFFQDKTRELALPFRAFVLNRSRAFDTQRVDLDGSMLGGDVTPELRSGLDKLAALAREEKLAIARDSALLEELRWRAGEGATAIAVPELPQGADDIGTLVTVADVLARS